MAKLTLNDLTTLANPASAIAIINANSAAIEAAVENTLSRDGTSPNQMTADHDMNSNSILNLADAIADTDGMNKRSTQTLINSAISVRGTVQNVLGTSPVTITGAPTVEPVISIVLPAGKLLGRGVGFGTGNADVITLGTNLSLSGTTLNAATGSSSPLTTKGDIYTYSTSDLRLPVGTNGQVLSADSAEPTGLKWTAPSGGISDGDKGDITVSGSGSTLTIDNGAVTLAKMAVVEPATVFYRKTGGTGVPEIQLLGVLKTDLGLTGTNTGDQTSIVGITGTLAQFNAACTDADFLSVASAISTYQPVDGTLTALAGANWALNSMPLATGADTVAQTVFATNTFPARASTGNLAPQVITDFGLSLLDDASASTGRTTLGLGTAAVENIGTSGATVPLLSNANTWSATQTFGFGSAVVSGDMAAAFSVGGTHASFLGTGYGVRVGNTIGSSTSSSYTSFITAVATEAAAFTVPLVNCYVANGTTIGAGSAITTGVGFSVPAGFTTAITNYGIRGQVPSGASNWNLFLDGTAKNHLLGNTSIGASTDTGEKLQVTGTSKFTSTATFTVAPVFTDAANTRAAIGLTTLASFDTACTDDNFAGLVNTVTLTNKRITARLQSVTSATTVTPSADSDDVVIVTGQAVALTLAAPSGTPTQGQKIVVRLKDNGTAQTITFNAIYRSIGIVMPTTTVSSKTMYLGFIYNLTDSKWDCVALANEA